METIQVLDNMQALFPHLQEQWQEIRLFYEGKLWYQLLKTLLNVIKDEMVLSNGVQLITFTDQFVKNFCLSLDPLKYVKYICVVAQFHQSSAQSQSFLEEQKQYIKDKAAMQALDLAIGVYNLEDGKFEEVQEVIKTTASQLSKTNLVAPFVFSQLYYLNYKYFQHRKEYHEFYLSALQFLAYTPDEDITSKQKLELSLQMAYAILISPKIYNFSELLQQEIIISLKNSQYQWIYTLLETYNLGDVKLFNQNLANFSSQINSVEILQRNKNTLQDKIKIMALLDLIFNLPKNDRVLDYQQIIEKTNITESEVEFLVMKSLALDLIKGDINQVYIYIQIDKKITITHIIPRILNIDRLNTISQKFSNWQEEISALNNKLGTYQFLQEQI